MSANSKKSMGSTIMLILGRDIVPLSYGMAAPPFYPILAANLIGPV